MKKILFILFYIVGTSYGMELKESLKKLKTKFQVLEDSLKPKPEKKPIQTVPWSIPSQNTLEEMIDSISESVEEAIESELEDKSIDFIDAANQKEVAAFEAVGRNAIKDLYDKNKGFINSPSEETSKRIYGYIEDLVIQFNIALKSAPRRFTACDCISIEQRIALMVMLLQAVEEKHPDKEDTIIFTAFAPGGLLQEMLTVDLLLKAGYKNIILNLIDLGYPDPVELRKIDQAGIPENEKKHIEYLLDRVNHVQEALLGEDITESLAPLWHEAWNAYIINNIKDKFKEKNVEINLFSSAQDYLEIVEKRKKYTTILTMVDPDIGFFRIPAYPSQANVIGLQFSQLQGEEPEIYIFMPSELPISIYAWRNSWGQKPVQDAIKEILGIAKSTNAVNKFTPLFRNQFYEKFSSADPQMIDESLQNYVYRVSWHLKNSDKFPKNDVQTLVDLKHGIEEALLLIQENKWMSVDLALNFLKGLDDNKIQQLANLTKLEEVTSRILADFRKKDLKQARIDVQWYSDPHVAFQKLVQKVTDKNSIIYELYQTDPIKGEMPKIEKINRENYSKADVITPNSGKDLVYQEMTRENEPLSPEDQIRYARVDLATGKLIKP